MSKLHIGEGLALPKDVVTSTLIVYGGKGMGKTNFGSVLVEELTKTNLRWSVLDPIGVWWGLRHSKDGKGPGIECLILGGTHGDIPIEPTGGGVAADLVADEQVNVLIDFSRKPSGEMWGIGEKTRFATEYASRLFQRQGELINGHRREPLFQILDEAARYIPQMLPAGNPELAKCLSAWNIVVEEGRNIGLGVGLLTQRSARMNKSVSELADAMIAFRTVGPNSIEAVMDWMGEHVAKARIKELVEEIRQLDRGTCMVVSPGWLKFEGTVVAIRERETFDSSATPKPGERDRKVSGEAAKPDLAKYLERMQATIERAKADDPKELKKKIAELEREAKKAKHAPVAQPAKAVDPKAIERAVREAVTPLRKQLETIQRGAKEVCAYLYKANVKLGEIASIELPKAEPLKLLPQQQWPAPPAGTPSPIRHAQRIESNGNGDSELKGPERRILNAIAWLNSIGVEDPEQTAVAFLAGYTIGGGAFNNPRGRLNQLGFVEYVPGEKIRLTEAGRNHAQAPDTPLDADELQRTVLARLPGPERKILSVLLENREGLTNSELAGMAGYSGGGGAYNNPRGRLRSLGLIEYQGGKVVPKSLLFLEA